MAPPAFFSMTGSTFFADQEHGLEIVVELRIPDLLAHGHGVAGRRAADIVDEDVDAPEFAETFGNGRFDLSGPRHVTAAHLAGTAFLLDNVSGLTGGFFADIGAEHPRTLSSKQDGGCLAVAPAIAHRSRATDEGDFAVQPQHVLSPGSELGSRAANPGIRVAVR
jgi:hypothetical protein